jgi:D-alanine transaminase
MKSSSKVYLNQQFLPKEKAFISPEDRGFYFADGVYEVIKYYKGYPFCFDAHMTRLRNSLAGVRISFNRFDELADICDRLIEENRLISEYAGVYIQVTRGVAARTHSFPSNDVTPTLYIRAFPMPTFLSEMRNGVRVISRDDIRWLRCNIKSIALLPNTLIFQEAMEAGAFECLLIRDGKFTEATHSNIMMVRNGMVFTHPDSNLILPGITRTKVIKLCSALSVGVIEKPVKADDINSIEECFITGTGSEIIPVVMVDNTVIGNGKPGPVTRMIQKAFFKITYEELAGEKITVNND